MKDQHSLEQELKHLIVESLMLEDMGPEDIDSEEALFEQGLGLDSIDALELGMAISKKYHINLSQDPDENKEHFSSVKALADYVSKKILQDQECAT